MIAKRYNFTTYLSLTVFSFLLITTVAIGPAQAQQDQNARLTRIENEIDTLSRAVFRGEKPPASSLAVGDNVNQNNNANTELRLQQIELELRKLTGEMEQRNFDYQQFQSKTEQTISAMEMRISALEMQQGGSAKGNMPPALYSGDGAPSATSPSYGSVSSGLSAVGAPKDVQEEPATDKPASFDTTTIDVSAVDNIDKDEPADETQAPTSGQLGTLHVPADGNTAGDTGSYATAIGEDPVSLYENAFSLLKDKNFAAAEKGFQDFLNRYPSHDLAANAKYWLGESFYARNDYERAARTFAEAYQQYPKGPKGPDNLLKLGMSLAGLGKKDDACVTYGQLKKEYPQGAMPILNRAAQEMEKLGCQQF